mgnify:CR=1 FL=1
MVYLYQYKKASKPKCGDCKQALQGIPAIRPTKLAGLNKSSKTISRAYGGCHCAACVRSRIVRAFLIEEQKIVKKLMVAKAAVAPAEEAAAAPKKK